MCKRLGTAAADPEAQSDRIMLDAQMLTNTIMVYGGVYVPPAVLTKLIKEHWNEVAFFAHRIHGADDRSSTERRRNPRDRRNIRHAANCTIMETSMCSCGGI